MDTGVLRNSEILLNCTSFLTISNDTWRFQAHNNLMFKYSCILFLWKKYYFEIGDLWFNEWMPIWTKRGEISNNVGLNT